jgi:hypothetical protein
MTQVDSPPDMLHVQQQQHWDDMGVQPKHLANQTPAAGNMNAGHSMVLDLPATGSSPHRQLLFTPPQQLADAAKRRMLPEEYNATWGLDILDQGGLPLDDIYHYTYNGALSSASYPTDLAQHLAYCRCRGGACS